MSEKRRYKIFFRILYILAGPFVRWRMNYSAQVVRDLNHPTLIISNHTTDWDPLLVSLAFNCHMFFVASEHIFRWKPISHFLSYVFGPIARVKGRADARTVMSVLRTIKNGHHVALFAEGVRTYSGVTRPIIASTGKLVKTSGADLVTFQITGGYFASPPWAKSLRRGRTSGRVAGRYSAAQLKEMSAEEITALIQRDIHVDAYADQEAAPVAFKGKLLAENLETALYLCPACGAMESLTSEDDRLTCRNCGLSVRYTEYGRFEGDAPYDTVTAWDAWQTEKLHEIISAADNDDAFICDDNQQLYAVDPCISAELVETGTLTMTKSALKIGSYIFPYSSISGVSLCAQRTFTFTTGDNKHYEIKSEYPRSAVKYEAAYLRLKGQQA
ncbi:MAG: lysophospholipid acyltransferase family protein [Christensenellales bacterium]|jgi:ribosomal protein S27AE